MNNETLILEELRRISTKLGQMEETIGGLKETTAETNKAVEELKKTTVETNKAVEELKETIEEMKEDAEITRDGVNSLLSWAEECGNVIKFPLPRIAK